MKHTISHETHRETVQAVRQYLKDNRQPWEKTKATITFADGHTETTRLAIGTGGSLIRMQRRSKRSMAQPRGRRVQNVWY